MSMIRLPVFLDDVSRLKIFILKSDAYSGEKDTSGSYTPSNNEKDILLSLVY
jgi:hypothetical protein